jgi:surface polysaccharide O-acyltransferase-like enzyme
MPVTRDEGLDSIRALAIFAVIGLHVIGFSFYSFPRFSPSWNLLLVLDQIFRFAVPSFVAISGYVLASKYAHADFVFSIFFKKRILRILPLYFFFSFTIFYYTRFLYPEPVGAIPLWKIIFLGKADYHLYFVSMIFQFYLLFPVFLFFFNKFRKPFIIFALALQMVVYLISTMSMEKIFDFGFIFGDQQQYVFFGTWIFYFVLGMLFAKVRFDDDKTAKLAKISLFFVIFGLFFMFFDAYRLFLATGNLITSLRSTRLPAFIYTSGFVILFLLKHELINKFLGRFSKWLIYFGRESFTAYLVHTLVLRILLLRFEVKNLFGVFLLFVATLTLSFIVAELTRRISVLPGLLKNKNG